MTDFGKIILRQYKNNVGKIVVADADGNLRVSSLVPSDLSGGSATLNDLTDVNITTPTSGDVLSYDGSNWSVDGPLSDNIFMASDHKSNSTNGGTFTSGAWRTRGLNTVDRSASWASLSSNQITLEPGKYRIQARLPAFEVRGHGSQFVLISGTGTSSIRGASQFNRNSNNQHTFNTLHGYIEVTATAVYELQHQCSTTASTNGLGVASSFSVDEVYSTIVIVRIAK